MDFTGGMDGLTTGIEDNVAQAYDDAANKSIAASHAAPSTDTSLAELRWEGMTNAQLAAAVQQLNNGSGAAAMTEAADALANVAADLSQINDTLQTQLQAIGVNWQSQTASDLADQMLSASAAYGGTVTDQGGQGSTAINQQAEAYATARNAAPQPQALASNTQPSSGSPLTGHGTDQAQQASQSNAARNQAIDAMNNYTSASQSNLGGYQPPAPPPAIGLHPQPSTGTSTSGYTGPSAPGGPGAPVLGGGGPGGVGTLPPGGSGGGLPGSTGPVTGVGGVGGVGGIGGVGGGGGPASGVSGGFPGGVSGGGSGGTGGTGGTGGVPGGGSGGFGGGPGGTPGPGQAGPNPVTGIGPTTGSGPVSRAAGMPAPAAAGAGEEIGEIAAGAAVAGGTAAVGIVGANVNKGGDDEHTSRDFNEPGGFADDDDDFNPTRVDLAELDADQAAAARMNAELSAPGPAAPGVLEPALGRRDDDTEHRNSYAATDDDFFDDGRMVIPDVLGGNAHDRTDDDEQDA